MKVRLAILVFILSLTASAQMARNGTVVPQGSSIPGLGSLDGVNAPGYIEIGGDRNRLTDPNPPWTDIYVRGALNMSEKNVLNLDLERQARFGDSGYFGVFGLTHTFNSTVYASGFVGSSAGGAFLPKFRTDGFINIKMLPRKQFVANLGMGYDHSKLDNSALRYQLGGTYYFEHPWIIQGGTTITHANPGGAVASTYNLAVTQGRVKEHYITVRAELGREAYEVVNANSALVNFPIHIYDVTWRQWIGMNWGINASFERALNPYYNRNGATIGLFLDF